MLPRTISFLKEITHNYLTNDRFHIRMKVQVWRKPISDILNDER